MTEHPALTISWTPTNSLSPVMGTDWTSNLSRHLKSRGVSCFIACCSTGRGGKQVSQRSEGISCCCLDLEPTRHFNIVVGFDATRVWPHTISMTYQPTKNIARCIRGGCGFSYCLGTNKKTKKERVSIGQPDKREANSGLRHTLK